MVEELQIHARLRGKDEKPEKSSVIYVKIKGKGGNG